MCDNLREALRESNITQAMLAKLLDLSEKSVTNKLNGQSDWTLPEANKVKAILPKYSADWLFDNSNHTA